MDELTAHGLTNTNLAITMNAWWVVAGQRVRGGDRSLKRGRTTFYPSVEGLEVNEHSPCTYQCLCPRGTDGTHAHLRNKRNREMASREYTSRCGSSVTGSQMNDFFSNVKKRLSAYFMRIRTQLTCD